MRNNKLDLARGLLMLYIIVIIHGVFWLDLIPRPYSTILLLEMPLIFLISGYAYALATKDTVQMDIWNYLKYVRSRAIRILVPYLVYAFACALLVIYLSDGKVSYLQIIWAWLNPLHYGSGFSLSCLNWHLWFIPSFLIVTILLPVCKTKYFSDLHIWPLFSALSCMFLVTRYFDATIGTSFFYFIWAFLGFKIGSGYTIGSKQLFLLGLIGLAVIVVAKLFFNANLDMQSNKFPPNYLFFAFGIAWATFVLFISSRAPGGFIAFLARSKIVDLFVKNGYSLYLWQGLGYALAKYALKYMDANIMFVWLTAVLLTIIFGIIASPIEKIRFRM